MANTMTKDEMTRERALIHTLVELLPPDAVLPVKQAANVMRWRSEGDAHIFAQLVCGETHERLERGDYA